LVSWTREQLGEINLKELNGFKINNNKISFLLQMLSRLMW
jgi:hypothetical protein